MHYPVQMITRNLSIGTMFGDVSRILTATTKEVIETARWRDKGHEFYVEHLGGVNLTVVNEDPVTYGCRVMGLPSMGDIANSLVKADSEPKFKPDFMLVDTIELTKKDKDVDTIIKVLSELNSEASSLSEEDNGLVRQSGMFLLADGETSYMKSYIKYDYHGYSIKDALCYKTDDAILFAKKGKDRIDVDNTKYTAPQNVPPIHSGDFINLTDKEIIEISKADTFTLTRKWGEHLAHVPMFQMYFPFKYFNKQIDKDYEEKGSNKYVLVKNYRYRVLERKQTYSTEFKFDIVYKDFKLTITQIIDWVNLEYKGD
ncbi:MAG: hypothetical protein ACRCX2_39115 [Paraclostridium sp.]